MGTRGRVAAGTALVLLVAGAILVRSRREADRVASPPGRGGAVEEGRAPAPGASRGSSGTGPAPSAKPPPTDGERALAFHALTHRLQEEALDEIGRELEAGGGRAALRRIRAEIAAPLRDDAARVRQAFFVRLLGHVAAQDPSVAPDAVALAGEILRDRALGKWTRFQATAALSGLHSVVLTVGAPPGTLVFAFIPDPGTDHERGPYEASLAGPDGTAGALLLDALRGNDSDPVRVAAALGLGRTPSVGTPEALRAALLADDDEQVRLSCLHSLEAVRSADLPALARQLALEDEYSDLQAASLRALARTSAADPATQRFLADCLLAGKPEGALGALAESGFEALAKAPSAELQQGLSSLLVRSATETQVVETYVARAVEGGMAQFLPLFRLMEGTLPADDPLRATLSEGARKLEQAPAYAALAGQLRETQSKLRGLWDELNRAGLPPERRTAVREEISALIFKSWAQQDALRK
jgi:hypothetical protein